MGFQTNISILNDHWHDIAKEPEKFVAAIGTAMNYGTDNLSDEVRAAEGSKGAWGRRYGSPYEEGQWANRHGVTVHRAQHADVPQITFTQRNSSWDIWDLTNALEKGLLKHKSNPETYGKITRGIVEEMRDQANRLERALRAAEKALETTPDEV